MLRRASEVERASGNAGRNHVSGEILRAMSQERVERLHRDYETFNATKRIDDAAIAPDVVVIAPDNMLGGGVLSGREALAQKCASSRTLSTTSAATWKRCSTEATGS
jgi:hypothetical protein